ncbi:VRR-NUC domain-containing protein [Streptomyces clavifer]|uniref:VRR-NUC domain-containing protein n=1 Tax=Streptomyces clavifer TaxID=68188 RepID=UPI00364FB237
MKNDERATCQHVSLSIVNPHELLWKYKCGDCQAVLTCSCDEEIALYVLPHQAARSIDAQTRIPVQVTEPLVAGVYHECRGKVPPAFPARPHRGAASLVHRFYWREIHKETNHRFIQWAKGEGLSVTDPDGVGVVMALSHQHMDAYKGIEQTVVRDIREQHERQPKYDFSRQSDSDILAACKVATEEYSACYVTPTRGHVEVIPLGSADIECAVGVEEFVAQQLRQAGRQVMLCESRPFHALYATLMWLWVQDPRDPCNRPAGFGGRSGGDVGQDDLIWTILPEDFGSPVHATRRAGALEEHLASLPCEMEEFLWLFDYWTSHAEKLRQYLWAHRAIDVERGRRLIEILGPTRVKGILRFLADDYWGRYLGWPDLVSWDEGAHGVADIEFVEVKSSSDKLSEDQRDWIVNNHESLKLPFKVAKVHRVQRIVRP